MINDCRYDKIKLLYKFSKIMHYIKKHAKDDAQKEHDQKFHVLLAEIEKDLAKTISQLDAMICK